MEAFSATTQHFCFLSFVIVLLTAEITSEPYKLSIIHINDFHARFEPTDTSGGVCAAGAVCIGGYARTVSTVRRLLDEHKNGNVVYLNAGDSFQGTLWYNLGRWNVTSEFMNIQPADAMTLGNHEFDHGIDGVVPYLAAIKSPMMVANMDSSKEPQMKGMYEKSMIIERGNRKIGIIGVILEATYNIANTGKLVFHNESDAIREEAQKLKAEGANIIVVVSHCGYDVDQVIAKHAGADVDVIVGGHTHTFLYTGSKNPGPDTPGGDYPTEVIHKSGNRVLIVQAAAYAKYVGFLEVVFDEAGNVLSHQGAPIYMDSKVPEDPEVLRALEPWKEIIDVKGNVVVGVSKVNLEKEPCSSTECNLGNFFCDSMVHSFTKTTPFEPGIWTSVSIGIVNTGALRVPLFKGNLTYAQIVAMSPFENILTAFNLRGDRLLQALEYSVEQIDLSSGRNSSSVFLQVAGLQIIYNFSKPVGSRVVQVKARCAACSIPKYELLDKAKIYRIVAPDFLVDGGDGFSMIRESATDLYKSVTDIDALLDYTEAMSPIITGVEGRIRVLND